MRIGIADYGVGNIYSLRNALESLEIETVVSKEAKVLDNCAGVVLPGVGAFADAISNMKAQGLDEAVMNQAAKGKLILGICLGMQILFDYSTEGGEYKGLGLLKGWVDRVPEDVKVPHMGWNTLKLQGEHKVLHGIKDGDYVYYVHSYYVRGADGSDVWALSSYGVDIPAVAGRGNIIGMQFHPEKSGETGLRILKNVKELIK